MSQEGAATGRPALDSGSRPRSSDDQVPHTGDEALDAALAELAGVAARPLDVQVQTYVGVHRALQARLADLEG